MADPYVDVIAQNTAEGGVNGEAVTTVNSGGDSGRQLNSVQVTGDSTLTYTTVNPIHGNVSYRCEGVGGFATIKWTSAAIGELGLEPGTRSCGVVYVRFEFLPTGYTNWSESHTSTAGNLDRAYAFRIGSAGQIRIHDANNANIATSTDGIQAGVVYRFEWEADHHAGDIELRWYRGDNEAAEGTLSASGQALGDAVRMVNMGRSTSPNLTLIVDDWAMNSEPIGVRTYPRTVTSPVELVANPGNYVATNITRPLAVIRDNNDATYLESQVEPNGSSVTFRMGPRSRTDIVTVTLREHRDAASPAISTKVELVNAATNAVLGTRTYTATTAPADYTTVSSAAVPMSVDLLVRVTHTTL